MHNQSSSNLEQVQVEGDNNEEKVEEQLDDENEFEKIEETSSRFVHKL